jgi:hypothetical protein
METTLIGIQFSPFTEGGYAKGRVIAQLSVLTIALGFGLTTFAQEGTLPPAATPAQNATTTSPPVAIPVQVPVPPETPVP